VTTRTRESLIAYIRESIGDAEQAMRDLNIALDELAQRDGESEQLRLEAAAHVRGIRSARELVRHVNKWLDGRGESH
jgi:hypothetical protein